MKLQFPYLAILMIVALALIAPVDAVCGVPAPAWEVVSSTDSTGSSRDELGQRDIIEIVNRDGSVYISIERPVKVEIYSILGQLITSRTVKPGTVKLTMRQRGVYILKAGTLTRRINL